MAGSKPMQPGDVVGAEFGFPRTNCDRIWADTEFLARQMNLAGMGISGYENMPEHLARVSRFMGCADGPMHDVVQTYLTAGTRTPLTWDEEKQQNRYGQATIDFFPHYREYCGLFSHHDLGGKALPSAFIGGVSAAGFNVNSSFYLAEIVRHSGTRILEYLISQSPPRDKRELLENVCRQANAGTANVAMILTGDKTGVNLGRNMTAEAKVNNGGTVTINGSNKYITGYGMHGLPGVNQAWGILVSNDADGGREPIISLVPLNQIDDKGNVLLQDGKPVANPGIVTSRFIDKAGEQQQILQRHEWHDVKGIYLGRGWGVMEKIMERARLEIAAQANGLLYNLLHKADYHTTRKHLNVPESVPIAERPAAALDTNTMQAYLQTASAVLMDAGKGIDLALADGTLLNERLRGEQAVVRYSSMAVSSMLKAYMTRRVGELMQENTMLLGADGFVTSEIDMLRGDNEPLKTYEGPNAVMDKQVILEQTLRMNIRPFLHQTAMILKSIPENASEELQKMKAVVDAALNEFSRANEWAEGKSQKFKALKKAGEMVEAEKVLEELLPAGKEFTNLFGAVYMGREAIRTKAYVEKVLNGSEPIDEKTRQDLETRGIMAELAVHRFVRGHYQPLEYMQDEARFATVTPERNLMIKAAVKEIGLHHANGYSLYEMLVV